MIAPVMADHVQSILDTLPPDPYREQSKTRKRFARGTPHAVKERLRRVRNREAAQDLRNRKKRYEVALQVRLRQISDEVDTLAAEETALLEEQALLQLELEAALGGNPAPALSSAMDNDLDSKSWVTAGPRSIAAGLQRELYRTPTTNEISSRTVGTSIEPAVSSRIISQQTNSHPAVLGALACLMATTTAASPSSSNFDSTTDATTTMTTAMPAPPAASAAVAKRTGTHTSLFGPSFSPVMIKSEPDVYMESWSTPTAPSWMTRLSERPTVASSSLLSFNSLPMIGVG